MPAPDIAAAVCALAPGLGDACSAVEAAELVLGVLERPGPLAATDADRAAAEALLAVATTDLDAIGAGKRAIRRVLTGSDHGVPLPYVLAALPRDEVIARARAVLDQP